MNLWKRLVMTMKYEIKEILVVFDKRSEMIEEEPRWQCGPCPCHAASHGLLCRRTYHFMFFLSIPPPYWLHDFEPLGVHFGINLVIHVQRHSYHSQHLRRRWLQNAPTPTTLPLVFLILSPHTTVGTMLCKHSHLQRKRNECISVSVCWSFLFHFGYCWNWTKITCCSLHGYYLRFTYVLDKMHW